MRTRVMAVALMGALVAGACTDASGSVLSSATTTVPDSPTIPTTPTTIDGLPDSPPGGGGNGDGRGDGDSSGSDDCGDPPVWVLKRIDDPSDDPSGSDRFDDPSGSDDGDCEQPAPEPELGTGDVQITLRWSSDADLDLHVTEPDGTEIWFGDTGPTSTGGRLDVDSNIGCENDGSVENVFWEEGDMPLGEYQVEVVGYTVDGCGGGDYTVTAQVQGEEILDEEGSVAEDEEDPYSFEVN